MNLDKKCLLRFALISVRIQKLKNSKHVLKHLRAKTTSVVYITEFTISNAFLQLNTQRTQADEIYYYTPTTLRLVEKH